MNGTGTSGPGTTVTTPDATPSLLIDAKVARKVLCLGQRRLWELTNCKAIPSRKIGKSVRYSPAELVAWVECGCPTDAGAGDRVRKAVHP
jgi:predicted DNA-binding transcriptional regulator AlpA